MDKIELEKDLDIIDYVSKHPQQCRGRKIFTDLAMAKIIQKMADTNQKVDKKTVVSTIIYPKTGNETVVELVKEGSNCFWVKDIKADDIEPFEPVDKTKEAIFILNEPNYEKYEKLLTK